MDKNELSIPDKIIKNSIQDDLLKKYSKNTVIRGLIQAVPYGAVVDNLLTVSYNNILLDRAKIFYDELGMGRIELTPDLIKNEDFLHSYFSTYKAALFTKQREKIRFFARLLKNGMYSRIISKADEYDDYLKILDDLTNRELTILYLLDTYESRNEIKENENELQRADSFWNEFEKETSQVLNISPAELKGFLTRIERTGCYTAITGAYFGYTGGRGHLTETYFKLKELIHIKDEDLVYYRKL
ncbi:hypothetical protein RRV45_20355 [Bacillus sp. DTU_2020_1000418_1_SI_GHA_SEK_038]|uniref:hypothetical protein n=1 Tax=Bacillus sp. DTU_2020_1000418_1_SI_GHA_SEK_038 TaxID=3077585 RepID=UPI0028E4FA25|nr:hypothetical protein [Bacillus sp. DTU_2020_1000418_1_SI_GHA_SEK_038]WNS75198.1 hypothetical protein RRV45_20355 [Bacillus sp. DTU_2020_1000418_1_SI_GHA_SEK_038]